jgi:2-phospho-L-lactate guanylyltransferase
MQAALLPVRSLASAKGRLAASLTANEREALTREMLADMIRALASATSVERIFVVSADARVLDEARRLRAEPLSEHCAEGTEGVAEGQARGLNPAVAAAARELESRGVRRLLTIPGDVPLIDPTEVDELFAVDPVAFPVVLVPSAAGTGTNALLTSPPTVIEPRFEGASLEAHSALCRSLGIAFRVLALASFALDVDTPEDLAALRARR